VISALLTTPVVYSGKPEQDAETRKRVDQRIGIDLDGLANVLNFMDPDREGGDLNDPANAAQDGYVN